MQHIPKKLEEEHVYHCVSSTLSKSLGTEDTNCEVLKVKLFLLDIGQLLNSLRSVTLFYYEATRCFNTCRMWLGIVLLE